MKALMSSNCCSAACFSRALVLQPFVFSLCYNLLFFFVLKPSFSFNTATKGLLAPKSRYLILYEIGNPMKTVLQ